MDEYINREALIADIDEEIEHDSKMYTREQNYYIEKGLRIARKDIQSAPAADVVEVKHGKWILERELNGNPYCFHCSICDDDFHYIGIKVAYDYCPNCGAKMDGE